MPCYDGRDNVQVRTEYVDNPETEAELKRLSERCARLTDLLCKAGRAFVAAKLPPPEVRTFWFKHRALDEQHGDPW